MTVENYNPKWIDFFLLEKKNIENTLNDNCKEIYHIGSTAIPNMIAKPIIDILLIVNNKSFAISNLERLGYKFKGNINIPGRLYFSKKSIIKYHLHVVITDHPFISLNLMFRDFLRENLSWKNKYIALKKKLILSNNIFDKDKNIFSNYTLKKNFFIKEVLKKSGFSKYIINFPYHVEEMAYIKENLPNKKDLIHQKSLILYKGINIVGCAIKLENLKIAVHITEEHTHKRVFFENFVKKYLK